MNNFFLKFIKKKCNDQDSFGESHSVYNTVYQWPAPSPVLTYDAWTMAFVRVYKNEIKIISPRAVIALYRSSDINLFRPYYCNRATNDKRVAQHTL